MAFILITMQRMLQSHQLFEYYSSVFCCRRVGVCVCALHVDYYDIYYTDCPFIHAETLLAIQHIHIYTLRFADSIIPNC